MKSTSFIIESKGAHYSSAYVVAPVGYCRLKDGSVKPDGTPSPEMGPIQEAYKFMSHRSAARTASTMAYPVIHEINY